eukprot:jgi/Chrzof1/14635/Cz09g10080.t1
MLSLSNYLMLPSTVMLRCSDPAANWIADNLETGHVVSQSSMGSSDWASTYVYQTDKGASYFVKVALGGRDDSMFKGEALGLQAMYDTNTIRVPKVFHVGPMPNGRGSFIIMEHLNLGGSCNQAELGRQLALMHLAEPADPTARSGKFGFPVDNTIGATPQPNGWMDNWVDFYREKRLRHQLQLAGDNRLHQLGIKLMDNLEVLFEDIKDDGIKPSVLHGDLWSGNIAAVDGQPCIYDPATYYGHHEAEFGMSWCAGFGDAFYREYHKLIPKAPLFDKRRDLYLLYHYLNHYNLFGGGYYSTTLRLMEGLTSNL